MATLFDLAGDRGLTWSSLYNGHRSRYGGYYPSYHRDAGLSWRGLYDTHYHSRYPTYGRYYAEDRPLSWGKLYDTHYRSSYYGDYYSPYYSGAYSPYYGSHYSKNPKFPLVFPPFYLELFSFWLISRLRSFC